MEGAVLRKPAQEGSNMGWKVARQSTSPATCHSENKLPPEKLAHCGSKATFKVMDRMYYVTKGNCSSRTHSRTSLLKIAKTIY